MKCHPVEQAVKAVLDTLDACAPGDIGVGCSGGADSMALAHACGRVLGPAHIRVLHVDHQLQAGSGEVARRVRAWAEAAGMRCEVAAVTVVSGGSVEAAAREARYAAFGRALAGGVCWVLLGHTARDQAETVLMRLLRGTGPAGLAGIAPRRGRYLRPLLALDHTLILDYVARHRLPVWDDPMNHDRRFLRARVRHHLLPQLAAENPALPRQLVSLAESLGEWRTFLDEQAGKLWPAAQSGLAAGVLRRAPVAVARRAVSLAAGRAGLALEAVHLDAALALCAEAPHGTAWVDVPGGRVVREYEQLGFVTAQARELRPALEVRWPHPVVVRQPAPGDRMRPARLKGRSRKLSDLFVDQKVPLRLRAGARVVAEASSGAILWVEHLGAAHGIPPDVVVAAVATDAPSAKK
jgi:tRNA(Ile)-lysidine synthase